MPNIKPVSDLLEKLRKSEERTAKEGWTDADDFEKELEDY